MSYATNIITQAQATELATILRERRAALQLTMRDVEAVSGVYTATIMRLERAQILAPQPDTLKAVATALGLRLSDIFAVVGWVPADELPNFTPYLRARYHELPDAAVAELEDFFAYLAQKHGVDGPIDGEDER